MIDTFKEFDQRVVTLEKNVRLCLIDIKTEVIANKLALRKIENDVALLRGEITKLNESLCAVDMKLSSEKLKEELAQIESLRENFVKDINRRKKEFLKAVNLLTRRLNRPSLQQEIEELNDLTAKWDRIRHSIYDEYTKMSKALKSLKK
jgi:predicted  nucleic acid-binding Zn-ribbon protein